MDTSSVGPLEAIVRHEESVALYRAVSDRSGVAWALVVSVPTVERHIDSIYGKIGVHDRRRARQYTRAHGILAPVPATGT